jgi:hypothetical protein
MPGPCTLHPLSCPPTAMTVPMGRCPSSSSSTPSACPPTASVGRASSSCSPIASIRLRTLTTRRSIPSGCRPTTSSGAPARRCALCRPSSGPGMRGCRPGGDGSAATTSPSASNWRAAIRCPSSRSQYEALAGLLADLCARFPIAGITGHSDIAPGRKTDPGPWFSWGYLRRLLADAGHGEVARQARTEGRRRADDAADALAFSSHGAAWLRGNGGFRKAARRLALRRDARRSV